MKKVKRIVSLIVIAMLLLQTGIIMIPPVYAVSKNDAVNWLNNQNGAWYDLDGYYGAQCSDFVSAYMNWLCTGSAYGGTYGVYDANYYPTVASWNPERWEVIENYYDLVPQPGDIFISSGLYAEYNHVGVVISSGVDYATIVDQNFWTYTPSAEEAAGGHAATIHDIQWGTGSYVPITFIRYKGYTCSTHSWNSGTVTKAATCAVTGIKTYTCSVCGATKTEMIAKENHSWNDGVVTKFATCVETGIKTYTCSVCKTKKNEPIAKLTTHTWNSGVITTPATCTSEGVKTFTCTVCTATKTEAISKLDHTYTNKADAKYLKSAATETSAAVYYKSCSVCGAKGTETFTFGDPVPPAVDTDTVLGVSSAKTMAGKEITLTLSLEKNPGAAGLSVSLNYDTSALTLKSATNGTLFTSFTSGKNFIFDNASNVTSDGIVATFTFTVNDNAAAGNYTVTPIVRSCVNDGGEDVAVKTEKGTVTVIDFIYGDANDDEMIDMKDVVLLRRYLAEFDYETNSSPVEIGFGADANGDGEIDMKDVVLLRKYLANYDYETDTSTEVLGPQ